MTVIGSLLLDRVAKILLSWEVCGLASMQRSIYMAIGCVNAAVDCVFSGVAS